MLKQIAKLIDLKSIITLELVTTLIVTVIYSLTHDISLDDKVFLLFSNVTTAVVTYYFTKKSNDEKKVK